MQKEIEEQRNYQVVKSNDLIRFTKNNFKVSELKALAFILSKVKPQDYMLQEYNFSIAEFCKVAGITYCGKNYKQVKDALLHLKSKSIWIKNKDNTVRTFSWISKAVINQGSGTITVKLDEDLKMYLIDLKNNYTQYELFVTLPMTSAYSFKMYELLKSYRHKSRVDLELEYMKEYLCATHYTNFKDFKRRVLEVAIREINEYTDIFVMWQRVTKGKKVIAISFEINRKGIFDRLKSYEVVQNKIK